MKKVVLFLLPLTLLAFTSTNLKPVDTADAVTFTIKNFGLSTNGSFKGLAGKIIWDAANPTASSFDVTIDANTINTDNEMRDSHLKKETYFDVEKYPKIRFTTTQVTKTEVTGNLTIKGVTQKISFPFTVTPSGSGHLFKGNFSINRRDFGVGSGSVSLGNEVNVYLKIQAAP